MALVSVLIFLLSLKFRSCQLQCVKEIFNGSEFSINVTTHIQVRAGDCIRIPYEITLPKTIRAQHKRIWFRGDPKNTVSLTLVKDAEHRTTDLYRMNGLPHGEYEFGIKLEWECNQTFIFPTRVRVSVSALTRKPSVLVPILTEGIPSRLSCLALPLCSVPVRIYWTGTKITRKKWPMYDRYNRWLDESHLPLRPTADDHNSNITCVAEYENNIVAEKTVTIFVKFAPRFLNGSQCVVRGKLLVCSCISWGNPPSPITWPVASLTDFSIKSHSKAEIVNSTLTLNAADFYNTSIKCVSSNEVGQRQTEIQIQNYTENMKTSVNPNKWQPCTALHWVAAVSVCLNLVLLISLIICIHKWCKRSKDKNGTEVDTYTTLNRAQIESDYSFISPQPR